MATSWQIGDEVWWKGDRYIVASEPYTLHCSQWQDCRNDSGEIVTIPTPAQVNANVAQRQQEWRDQQAQFRRLHNAKNLDN